MSITQSATFCPAPWTSLNIDQTGRVSCCMWAEQAIGNIKQTTIQEILHGPLLADIKQAMRQGHWHKNCVQCQENERVTGASARTQRMLDQISRQQIDQDIDWFEPQHLVINWSNLCNLTCTYCNDHTSTAWQAIKGIPIHHERNEHQDLIELAKQHGASVQGLLLGGGEPLLQKGLVEFLQYLDRDRVRVLVTTNLSVDLRTNPVYQELKSWTQVEWQISFDNADSAKFEYVRAGASWEVFVNNIRLMQADQQYIKAHPAYSLYCAYDLVDYYQFCVDNQLSLFWCQLTHPWDLDVRRLNRPLREQAQKEIDRVIDQFGHVPDMATDTLLRYRQQLEDNTNLININTYRADPFGYAAKIEKELQLPVAFQDLWPTVTRLLKEHWYA